MHNLIAGHADEIHGVFLSESSSEYQNACWIFEIEERIAERLKRYLGHRAKQFEQDSVAWLQGSTQFLE